MASNKKLFSCISIFELHGGLNVYNYCNHLISSSAALWGPGLADPAVTPSTFSATAIQFFFFTMASELDPSCQLAELRARAKSRAPPQIRAFNHRAISISPYPLGHTEDNGDQCPAWTEHHMCMCRRLLAPLCSIILR